MKLLRVESARAILDAVSDRAVPVIIAGDLNSTLPGLPGAQLDEAGHTGVSTLLDAGGFSAIPADHDHDTHATTFPSWKPARTIDWVIVRMPLEVQSVDVKHVDLSDHLPVITTVRFNEPD